MGAEGYVGKEVCEVTMEGMQRQIDTGEKRLNSHSTEIKALTVISEKLTQLIEIQSKQLEKQGEQMTQMVKDIAELKLHQAQKQQQAEQQAAKPKPWYESETGKFIIKAGVTMVFILLAAAIGKNFADALGPVSELVK